MSLDIYLYTYADTGGPEPVHVSIADMNITHNVSRMWAKAGVYEALYESNGHFAHDHVDTLREGLRRMREDMPAYRELNPPNGWGSADGALKWLEEWLAVCEKHPKALIRVSR